MLRILEPEAAPRGCKTKVFIDAREWEGHDLNLAVGRGALTIEQAFSIVRLRQAIGKQKTDNADEELVEAMWQDLLGNKEGRPGKDLDQGLTVDTLEDVQQ